MCVFLLVLQIVILVTADEEKTRTRRGVVFRDDFNGFTFNNESYIQELSLLGNRPYEFQIFTPEEQNTFVRDGFLHIKPTFTLDNPRFKAILHSGGVNLLKIYQDKGWTCNSRIPRNCGRNIFSADDMINPIMSGHLLTKASIRYGRVTVRAKIPKGAWLIPGNTLAMSGGINRGVNQVSSTLHWGQHSFSDRSEWTHGEKRKSVGDYHDFHDYKLEWTADHIQTYVDNELIMNIPTPNNTFWGLGAFYGIDLWQNGGKNAPFDKPFQVAIDLAVGGVYFPDNWQYEVQKPWKNFRDGPRMKAFWGKRDEWLSTWHGDDIDFIIDYIEMVQY